MMDIHQEGVLLHKTDHFNQNIWIKVHKRRKQNLRNSGKSLLGYLIWAKRYLNGDGRGIGGSWSSLNLSWIVLFMILAVCDAVPMKGCPGPDYIEHQNGYCCRVTSCPANYSVLMCVDDYGNDTCVPCPEGGFLLDPTTSETITRCVVPTCSKNITKVSPVKSTVLNPHACPMWCQCDLNFGYCGTDPCGCTKMKCSFGSVLQQDCGCQPITPSPPKTTTPKVLPVTESSKPISSSPPGNTTTEDVLSSHHTKAPGIIPSTVPSTTEFLADTGLKVLITKSPSDTGLSGEAIAGITVAAVVFIVIIIGIAVWQRRKNREKTKNVGNRKDTDNTHNGHVVTNIHLHMKRVNNLHVGESSDFHLTDDPTFQPLLAPTNNTTKAVIEGSLSSNCISSESVAMDCATDTEETANTSDRKPGSSGAEIKTDGSGDETHVKSAVTGDETQVKSSVTGDETQVKSVVTGDETQVKSVVTGDETQVKSAVTGDETQVKSAVTGDETQVKSVVTGDETQVKSSREKKMKGSKGEKQAKIANGWPRNETHEQAKQNGLVQPIFKGFIKDSSQED